MNQEPTGAAHAAGGISRLQAGEDVKCSRLTSMELAPSPLTNGELTALGEYNAAMSPTWKKRPEHGPDAYEVVPAPYPGQFPEEYHRKMATLQERFSYWQRVDLEANGKVIDITTDDGRPDGMLVIPWSLVPESEW